MQIDVEVSVYGLQEVQPSWSGPIKHWGVPYDFAPSTDSFAVENETGRPLEKSAVK